jgi:hypothetical protein
MTEKTTVTGTLDSVNVNRFGQYVFILTSCDGPPIQTFLLSEKKALAIANGDGAFPLGIRVKVTGRYDDNRTERNDRKLTHVKIVSVDGVEVTAWSQRVGSPTQDSGALSAAENRIKEAEEAEKAMVNKAPPEQPGTITDPLVAYENAMRIVRRQRRLKNPQLSQQDIWQVRDALNLLAEKLGIA